MSDKYEQPEYADSRLRYYDGQFLMDQDFIDEQTYHVGHQRRHEGRLHAAGITEGLDVTIVSGGASLTVSQGSAIDGEGRQVLLALARTVYVLSGKHGVMILEMIFKEVETGTPDQNSVVAAATRFTQEPTIALVTTQTAGSTLLAQVSVVNGVASSVDPASRVYAGVRLPAPTTGDAITLRTSSDGGGAELSGGLIAADYVDVVTELGEGQAVHLDPAGASYFTGGSVGIGTTAPLGELDVRVAGTTGFDRFIVTADASWGDADKSYVTIGAGGASGIMVSRPYVPWTDTRASIRYGRSGGTSAGSYWCVGVRSGNAFSFSLDGEADHKLWIADSGNIGIGTTDASTYKLRVEGTLGLAGDATLLGDRTLTFDKASTSKIIWQSAVNYGSDKAFILFKDNSSFLSSSGSESVRMSLGVFNDFGSSAAHMDALDLQGGAQLTLNAGSWDAELNAAIGTPATGTSLYGLSFRVNNTERMKINATSVTVSSGTAVTLGSTLTVSGGTTLSTLTSGASTLSSLTVSGATTLSTLTSGASTLSSLTVTNAATLGTLTSGASTLSSLTVSNAATVGSLTSGASTLSSLNVTSTGTSITTSGAVTVGTTLKVTGASTLASLSVTGASILASLSVTGASTLASLSVTGASILGSLSVTGASTLASLSVTGASTLASLSVTGAAAVGTLTSGAATLSSTLSVSGTATLGALAVTGNSTLTGDLFVRGSDITLGDSTTAGDRTILFDKTTTGKILWESSSNYGSDKAFILFKTDTTQYGSDGENARLSIGVFNDFTGGAADGMDLQGGYQLTLNAGTWDTELNTAIGTPGGEPNGIRLCINNDEKIKLTSTSLSVDGGLTMSGIPIIEIKTFTYTFTSTGDYAQGDTTVTFSRTISSVVPVLQGWDLNYNDREYVKRATVSAWIESKSGSSCVVRVIVRWHDSNKDDDFSGSAVIAVFGVLTQTI